jgi:hypothetical protein
MSNMSYCRFRNTLSDLRDCAYALYQDLDDWKTDLSDEEARAARALLKLCGELAADFGEDSGD